MSNRNVQLHDGPLDGQVMPVEFVPGKGWPEFIQFLPKDGGKCLIYRLKGEEQGYVFDRYAYEKPFEGFVMNKASFVKAINVPAKELEQHSTGLHTVGGQCLACGKALKWPQADPPPGQCFHCGYISLSESGVVNPVTVSS